jgi:protein-tyrosine phosphatase
MPTMRIACVCTGNTCRSPMMSALLRQALARHGVAAEVVSAGVAAAPGQPASAHAVAVLAEQGLDLGSHRASPVDERVLGADLLLCMSGRHALALIQGGAPVDRVHILAEKSGGIADPWGGSRNDYEVCAAQLANEAERIAAGLAGLS